VDSISPLLTNVTFTDSLRNGLELYGSSSVITGARFLNCGWNELLANAGSQPVIRQSSFLGGSSNWGLYNTSPATIIDARNNYWGAASGPYQPTSNPSGTGVRVSDGVDFGSWDQGVNLNLTINGTGGGTVLIEPPGTTTTASAVYNYALNEVIKLHALGNADSNFTGWSGGGCNGTHDCAVTLTGTITVTATFTSVPLIRIDGPTVQYFETIQAACNAVIANNTVIQAREHEFVETVVYGKPYSVKLMGGYDKIFTTRPGMSSIKGKLTLGAGKMTVDNVIVK
jgi:hypothetical protein